MFGSFLNLFLLILHIGQTGSFPPPLSEKEEKELVEKMLKGDDSARSKLIEHNMRLVAHIVKKYYASAEDQNDLISIGSIGLIKAINSYNVEKKIKLATFASRCIENEILMYLRRTQKTKGEVSFDEPLKTGDRLVLCDMSIYSMVKNNTFNGMALPSIYYNTSLGMRKIREFSYDDFRCRL